MGKAGISPRLNRILPRKLTALDRPDTGRRTLPRLSLSLRLLLRKILMPDKPAPLRPPELRLILKGDRLRVILPVLLLKRAPIPLRPLKRLLPHHRNRDISLLNPKLPRLLNLINLLRHKAPFNLRVSTRPLRRIINQEVNSLINNPIILSTDILNLILLLISILNSILDLLKCLLPDLKVKDLRGSTATTKTGFLIISLLLSEVVRNKFVN